MTIRLLTYNVNHKAGQRAVQHFFQKAVADYRLNLLVVQEAAAQVRRGAIQAGLNMDEWYLANLVESDPIFVKVKGAGALILRAEARVWLSEQKNVGSPGAGPPVMNEKWGNVVAVDDPATPGARLSWFLNKHDVPSVQLGGDRDRLHEEQQNNALEFLRRQQGREMAVGDNNVTWNHPNMDPWRAAGYKQYSDGKPSHGNRLIDYGIGRDFVLESGATIPGILKDDHDGKVLVLR